jgi:hypothetical protein
MKTFIPCFLFTYLIVITCAAQENVIKPSPFTIKDSCLCKDDTSGQKLILQTNLKEIKIIVGGVCGADTTDSIRTWGGVKITNCNNCKVINEFELDNVHWYEVKAGIDTLFLNYYVYSGIKPFILLYQIFYTNENDSIDMKYRFHKDIEFADKNKLMNLKKGYTSVTENSIMKINKNFSNQKNMDLSFERLDLLGWQLLYASISGDNEAKNRLLNFQKYYHFINGALEEEFLLYPLLFNEMKEFNLIK